MDFDYIVVGSGSAGSVLASRLSERDSARVLLLEAGNSDRNLWLHVPIGWAKLYHDQRFNWLYDADPEPKLNKGVRTFAMGKVLGGSSAVNGMLHLRGQPEDYDGWSQTGLAGWDWKSVLPYFRKLETRPLGANEMHGGDGPVSVSELPERHPLIDAFIEAGQQAGLPRNPDFNSADQLGVGYFPSNIRSGRRISTATAYLRPAARRHNLKVITGFSVSKVLFDDRRAIGVIGLKEGRMQSFKAAREVILSAGTLESPAILQRSGIGPGDLLASLGIPIVMNAGHVGRNLKNHFSAWLSYRVRKKCTLNDMSLAWRGQARMLAQYLLFRKGYMAWGPAPAGAMYRSTDMVETPDVLAHLLPFGVDGDTGKLLPFSAMMFCLSHLRPRSSGYVEIQSSDPAVSPRFRFNYLSDPADCVAVEGALSVLRNVMRQPALAPFIDGEIETYHRSVEGITAKMELRGDSHHLTGTCRMGSNEDSVVDARLRLRGISGLRVADASIFPTMVSSGTHAPTIMLGEKASDMIIEDARI